MRVPGTGTGSTVAILALGVCVGGCSTRNLQVDGTGKFDVDGGPHPGDGGPHPTDGGPAGNGADVRLAPDGPLSGIDAHESACVSGVVQLPWTAPARLEIAVTANAVAVLNRQAKQADVRTYRRSGALIAGFQFAADAQFLPYNDSRFLLVARGVTGDFVATTLDPDLVGSSRLFTASANATEHLLGAVTLSASAVVAITDEHFVNIGTGDIVTWSTVLDAADRDALKTGRIYGIAARPDRVMVAWGGSNVLRLAALSASGALLARTADDSTLDYTGADTTSAVPFETGLLMFDGNPVRLTQIAFDLSRKPLDRNTQLKTFYRTAPRVAPTVAQGRPVAFWLTVFPANDNSQGFTTHQLYGCELDPADASTCLRTALIAATGLTGYDIAREPVAAAAFPGEAVFAIAHTDTTGASWLRIADLGCAMGR